MGDGWIGQTGLSERFPIYTRANVGEVFPDPVTPLTLERRPLAWPSGAGVTRWCASARWTTTSSTPTSL